MIMTSTLFLRWAVSRRILLQGERRLCFVTEQLRLLDRSFHSYKTVTYKYWYDKTNSITHTNCHHQQLFSKSLVSVDLTRTLSACHVLHCKVTDGPRSNKDEQKRPIDIPPKQNDSKELNVQSSEKPEEQKKPGILQRFKDAYKEYGKTLIGVHVVTSIGWYGAFYYAARTGIDVVPLLEWFGASERITKPFHSGAGDFAVAYLLYELAKIPRYVVTLAGTQFTVQFLRKRGMMATPAKEDSLRNLVKEGSTQAKTKVTEKRAEIKDKIDDSKDKILDRIEDRKDKIKDKYEDSKDKIKDRLEDRKDKIKEKIEDRKDKLKERIDERADKLKERIEDSREKLKDKLDDSSDKLKDKFRK